MSANVVTIESERVALACVFTLVDSMAGAALPKCRCRSIGLHCSATATKQQHYQQHRWRRVKMYISLIFHQLSQMQPSFH